MEYRVNRQIRAKEVRLIDQDGKQIGIVPLQEALRIAEERGLDLVEVGKTEAHERIFGRWGQGEG
jgi:translation initiation factor IF-3